MSSQAKQKVMSPEEFMAWERGQEFKHEYYAGEIVAMTGASLAHNRIAANLVRRLGNQLDGSRCQVYVADLRLFIPQTGSAFYSDVLVVCGKPELLDAQRDVLLNPKLVIEILSPSTERYDRNKKFRGYQAIESLDEYILISQDEKLIEQFARDGDAWRYVAWLPKSGRVELKSIQAVLDFDEVYEGVEIEPEGTTASG